MITSVEESETDTRYSLFTILVFIKTNLAYCKLTEIRKETIQMLNS